jgi:hypothetical protein
VIELIELNLDAGQSRALVVALCSWDGYVDADTPVDHRSEALIANVIGRIGVGTVTLTLEEAAAVVTGINGWDGWDTAARDDDEAAIRITRRIASDIRAALAS